MRFYLIDTNVLSELKKKDQADEKVRRWFAVTPANSIFLSVMTVGEIRAGIEKQRLKDPVQAEHLERWMRKSLALFRGHILPITQSVANRWGTICPGQSFPDVDGLIAATALEHGLIVVTRNVKDFERAGVLYLNPWEYES